MFLVQVVEREEEAIKLDGLSVAEMKHMRERAEKHAFQAEVNRMMKLIINSLYRNKEIFLRSFFGKLTALHFLQLVLVFVKWKECYFLANSYGTFFKLLYNILYSSFKICTFLKDNGIC